MLCVAHIRQQAQAQLPEAITQAVNWSMESTSEDWAVFVKQTPGRRDSLERAASILDSKFDGISRHCERCSWRLDYTEATADKTRYWWIWRYFALLTVSGIMLLMGPGSIYECWQPTCWVTMVCHGNDNL